MITMIAVMITMRMMYCDVDDDDDDDDDDGGHVISSFTLAAYRYLYCRSYKSFRKFTLISSGGK